MRVRTTNALVNVGYIVPLWHGKDRKSYDVNTLPFAHAMNYENEDKNSECIISLGGLAGVQVGC